MNKITDQLKYLLTASSIISENKERIGKKLWTSDPEGSPVEITNLENDEMEAINLSQKIKELNENESNILKIAILIRRAFNLKTLKIGLSEITLNIRLSVDLGFMKGLKLKTVMAILDF